MAQFKSQKTDQCVFLIGSYHTNDANDDIFKRLEQLWKDFRVISQGEQLLLIERRIKDIPSSHDDAIRKYGEAGASALLAEKDNISAICPEPSETEIRKQLCERFAPDLVAYSLIAQNLSGWFNQTAKSSLEDALQKTIERESSFKEIYGFAPNGEWFRAQHDKLFQGQYFADKEFLNRVSDPRKTGTLVNEVIAAKTEMRNLHIFSIISEQWNDGRSLFIVYGRGHFDFLESNLKKLIN